MVILVGAGLGVGAHYRHIKPWSPVVGLAALAIGVLAATASGEVAESWAFVLFDTAQAWAAAIGAALLASALERWRSTV